MKYNEATDSYQNEYMEDILDTGFKYDIPYVIDTEKYQQILTEYSQKSCFKNTDTVIFHADYSVDDDNIPWLYAFYVFPSNQPTESDSSYDCILFDRYREEQIKSKFDEFVHKIAECVKYPNDFVLTQIQKKLESEMDEKKKNIEYINKLLNRDK